jgi:hypothetical protein
MQKGSQFGQGIYSPQPDISIGPYSFERDVNLSARYNSLYAKHRDFFNQCKKYHKENCITIHRNCRTKFDINYNFNPRCFLAIEIERSGSLKHLLGDLVNAASLGKIGIVVAWDDVVLRKFIRILEYFAFLRERKHLPFVSTNLLLLTSSQIRQLFRKKRSEGE